MSRQNQIPVLEKAIRVLGALADGPRERAALARELGIAPATAYRIIQTFAQAGWVSVGDDGECELALGLLPVLRRLQEHDMLGPRMQAALESLTAQTGLASKVSVRDGDEALTVLRVNSAEAMALAIRPGARFHLALGSSGAVLLAAMSDDEVERILRDAPAECWKWQQPADVWKRVRAARGKSVVADMGSYRPDILGISAPLLGPGQKMRGVITLTGLRHGVPTAQVREWEALLARSAGELSQPLEQGAQHP